MGTEKILIMYSPNHWWDLFSTKEYAEILQESYLKDFAGKKNWSISLVSVESFDDYKNALTEFNANSYKN
jgi:hypothetical protein